MDGLIGGWMDGRRHKQNVVHTVNYDSDMKRSEALTQATVWMALSTQRSAREADTEGCAALVCLGS